MGNGVCEESSDDENLHVNDNGYHDAENDHEAEMEDGERVLSGKLSESSGYAGSDLYDFKVKCAFFLLSYLFFIFFNVYGDGIVPCYLILYW